MFFFSSKLGVQPIIWVEGIGLEALFSSLEFSAIMFDVVRVEGVQFSHIGIY